MTALWRLEVEGLGKIERAEVDVRPLTLFVGPNNSGKSYLASLLWGLVAMQGDLEPPEGPEREAVDGWLKSKLPRNQLAGRVDVGPGELALLDDLFRATLAVNAIQLTRRIFNSESVSIGALSLRNTSADRQLCLELQSSTSGDRYRRMSVAASDHGASFSLRAEDVSDEQDIPFARNMLMRHAFFGHMAQDMGPSADTFNEFGPIFLPASRTGFMQLYKAAARRSLRGAFRRDADESDWLDLTTPAFHFIDMIAFGLKAKPADRFAEEAAFIEQAMAGRLELVQGLGVNEYRYHPAGASAPLTMNLSSALVTELAPLVLVLRHLSRFRALVLEEPEAHLHPELQRRVAQVIVRLIRKGLCVWVTTHSENFCQEINNFIKLGSLPVDRRAEAQQKLGYGPQDFLDLDDVSGYEFKPDPGGERSHVVEMKRTGAGLVMPTFNRAIVRLSKDVAYLDSLLAQEES